MANNLDNIIKSLSNKGLTKEASQIKKLDKLYSNAAFPGSELLTEYRPERPDEKAFENIKKCFLDEIAKLDESEKSNLLDKLHSLISNQLENLKPLSLEKDEDEDNERLRNYLDSLHQSEKL